jgi:enoyl-CoA hydratase/carnithine racemase
MARTVRAGFLMAGRPINEITVRGKYMDNTAIPVNQTPVVLLDRIGEHIAVVTLNRPEARNAVNGAVVGMLGAIVQETEDDPDIWVVILTGAGGVFCAGADLKEVAAGRGASLGTEKGGFAGFVFSKRTKPWIAAVNGKALAGGCEIVLACDMVVAAENATFGLPEVLRGLMAAAGGLFRLPRALPRNIALELITTAGELEAQRAYSFGMVNRLVPTEQVRSEAIKLAKAITMNAPTAVRESLSVARHAADLPEEELIKLTRESWNRVAISADFQEGPRAFIEKRAPRWTGR